MSIDLIMSQFHLLSYSFKVLGISVRNYAKKYKNVFFFTYILKPNWKTEFKFM